jgi:predicted NAD/FAD-dependent oxidoreductase
MKNIAIIGAGLSGLRAALEFNQNKMMKVTIWEKSPSVGGRIATRRFDLGSVNHGAEKFDDQERVLKLDPMALEYSSLFQFSGSATDLPKALRKVLESSAERVQFRFKDRVKNIQGNGKLLNENNEAFSYDQILITSPLPQTRELLSKNVCAEVEYTKCILFIGAGKRIEMSEDFAEFFFEESDEAILGKAEIELNQKLLGLDVKKWRYAQVKKGVAVPFYQEGKVTLAGDAFDDQKKYNAASAWLSGRAAALHIMANL